MTAPPWGHKPPAVVNHTDFWVYGPSQLSPRCLYWLRRIGQGTWRPNRHFWKQGADGRALWLGTWIWETQKTIVPLLANKEAATRSRCAQALGHDLSNCCQGCHGAWEDDGTYMCDGYDWAGRDLHTCCNAAIASVALRQLVPWHLRQEARR